MDFRILLGLSLLVAIYSPGSEAVGGLYFLGVIYVASSKHLFFGICIMLLQCILCFILFKFHLKL